MAEKRHNTSGMVAARAISTLCEAQGLTWRAVAERAGVSQNWLFELRKSRSPNVECIQAVAAVLGVTPWVLLWPESAAPGGAQLSTMAR